MFKSLKDLAQHNWVCQGPPAAFPTNTPPASTFEPIVVDAVMPNLLLLTLLCPTCKPASANQLLPLSPMSMCPQPTTVKLLWSASLFFHSMFSCLQFQPHLLGASSISMNPPQHPPEQQLPFNLCVQHHYLLPTHPTNILFVRPLWRKYIKKLVPVLAVEFKPEGFEYQIGKST